MIRSLRVAALAGAALLLLTGCAGSPAPTESDEAALSGPLTVYAAASLSASARAVQKTPAVEANELLRQRAAAGRA